MAGRFPAVTESCAIAVIGGGNGGQAMAGHLAVQGHAVTLCSRDAAKLAAIRHRGGIQLTGELTGFGRLEQTTSTLGEAVSGKPVIMITSTADGHRDLALRLAPLLRPGQIVVLNPGRTGGAIEFRHVLQQQSAGAGVMVAETQSLVYACRAEAPGTVRILGVKGRVLFAALPRADTEPALEVLRPFYPCFQPAPSVLTTSLENVGSILHCPITLFNAAPIERGDRFKFYHNITPHVARFIERLDEERMRLGDAYGVDLHTAQEWVSYAYATTAGEDLWSKVRHNPAYDQIEAPAQLRSRMLTEDIPTGILPMLELGMAAGLDLKLMRSVCDMAEALLEENFRAHGRTLANLGFAGLPASRIKALIEHG